ncbi:rubrerythrin [Marinitoga sp. 1137]|uniref:rubrerythrin family protein n=1 Tax=Marinitoga sp. 1137 TaxID=1545835 RepID=UPI000950436F|nr:rubrerythrin family protein [Marinitoga sp. 1137]APT75083.1 rubrerythrin [Marinitoga sp. 1137]
MVKKEMTRKFLEDAFTGESKAHMKYTIYAEDAEAQGKKNLARLWRAIAYAEFVHARNHFKALGYLGSVGDNLEDSAAGEHFEIEEMYPVYKNASEFQEEKEAVRSAHYALEAEKIHEEIYKEAKKHLETNEDLEDKKVYVCKICGYTTFDEIPEKCPVCGATSSQFEEF